MNPNINCRYDKGNCMKKYFSLLIIFILAGNTIFAQRIIAIDDAIAIALKQSYSILTAKQTLLESQKNLEATKMGLRSSVNMEFDLPSYSRSLRGYFDTDLGKEQYYSIGNTSVESRLSITQPILFTNGTLSVTGSLLGRDQFSEQVGTSRDYYSNLSVTLRQPLFVYNSLAGNLEKAEINLDRSERTYSQAERDIIYNVTEAFYNLYKAKKSVEIAEEKVKQTEDSYNTAASKFKAGLIAEVEALQLEVDFALSKNQLLNSKQDFEERKNDFKLLVGLDNDEDFEMVAELEYSPVELDVGKTINIALENRPEIKNAEADLKINELSIEEVDSRKTIKAEIYANYGINKNDELFDNIFRNFLDTRSVSLTVTVPVWDWGKNNLEVEAAEASQNKSLLSLERLKKQIKKEIQSAISKLNSAKARVNILRKNVEVAEKSYEISMERFKSGHITSFDLSQTQLKLTDAKQNNLNAIIDYLIAMADLERKTTKKLFRFIAFYVINSNKLPNFKNSLFVKYF